MTDYPSIRLEDVREGDLVRGTGYYSGNPATVQGAVWVDPDGALIVGGHRLRYLTDLRLVSMGRCCTPPEPLCPFSMGETVYVKGAPKPLTVAGWNYYPAWGKWMVRCEDGTQVGDGELAYWLHPPLELTSTAPEPPLRVGDWVRHSDDHESQLTRDRHPAKCKMVGCTRIEPPVGWPVGVPTEDGGTRWYVKPDPDFVAYECRSDRRRRPLRWADLLAAGGVPALAVTK